MQIDEITYHSGTIMEYNKTPFWEESGYNCEKRKVGIITKFIDLTKKILEIGPSYNPILDHMLKNVYAVDFLTKQQIAINYKTQVGDKYIPETNFLLSEENDFDIYKCIGDIKFDYIVSSHNFEHFPNFIKYLNSLENVLSNEGKIVAFVPDSRFIFDEYRNVTSISKLISDFHNNKKKPSFLEWFECNTYLNLDETTPDIWTKYINTINIPFKDYLNERKTTEYNTVKISNNCDRTEIDKLYKTYTENNYLDCHVSIFTPKSFTTIMNTLYKLNYTSLRIIEIHSTKRNNNEFAVILKKSK